MREQGLDPASGPAEGALDVDARIALEIAEFVADRARHFVDQECQAWAVTDFGVWAVLAGQSPKLTLELAQAESSDKGSSAD
jgi:hypothetical protein